MAPVATRTEATIADTEGRTTFRNDGHADENEFTKHVMIYSYPLPFLSELHTLVFDGYFPFVVYW